MKNITTSRRVGFGCEEWGKQSAGLIRFHLYDTYVYGGGASKICAIHYYFSYFWWHKTSWNSPKIDGTVLWLNNFKGLAQEIHGRPWRSKKQKTWSSPMKEHYVADKKTPFFLLIFWTIIKAINAAYYCKLLE